MKTYLSIMVLTAPRTYRKKTIWLSWTKPMKGIFNSDNHHNGPANAVITNNNIIVNCASVGLSNGLNIKDPVKYLFIFIC